MVPCAETLMELATLSKEREVVAGQVDSDQGDVAELKSEGSHINPHILAAAEAQLAAAQAKLKQLDDQIAAEKQAIVDLSQTVSIQPQSILDIQFTNPDHPAQVDSLLAQTIALGQQNPTPVLGGTFPSINAQQEWKQVLPADPTNAAAHNADYEGSSLVGAVGWLLNPDFSGGDVPFDHPFGFDWEFMVALDQPAGDPNRYTFLLTPADQSCSEDGFPESVDQVGAATTPQGLPLIPRGPDGLPSLLGVEIDGGLVPAQFNDPSQCGVSPGDRIAVFGRWIVDCGHQVDICTCDNPPQNVHPGLTAFRTEIHPPLLMAAAKVTSGSLTEPAAPGASEVTRVLFTSRPYLVGQRYTTDTGNVYDDGAPDDGTFVPHMINEYYKLVTARSTQLEAHPKIKSTSFEGPYELHLTARAPAPAHSHLGTALHGPLVVSFQFTVRSGCWVQVTPNGSDGVDIAIRLNETNYPVPDLPPRHGRSWTKDELAKLNSEAAAAFDVARGVGAAVDAVGEAAVVALLGTGPAGEIAALAVGIDSVIVQEALSQGILTDEYETGALTGFDLTGAGRAVSAPADSIPGVAIRAQIASLMRQRDDLAGLVLSDQGDVAELKADGTHVKPQLLAAAEAKLAADQAQLAQVDAQIAALMAAVPQGVVHDDTQPFPVSGWLEVGYLPPQSQP